MTQFFSKQQNQNLKNLRKRYTYSLITHLGVPSIGRVEAGFAIGMTECIISWPSWTLAAQVPIEVSSEHTAYTI